MLLELPHDSSSLKDSVYFAVKGKKERFIVLPLIWLLLCLSLENRHYLLTCECSCILCPTFENFARIMANFSVLGMRLHPHAVRLWLDGLPDSCVSSCIAFWKGAEIVAN